VSTPQHNWFEKVTSEIADDYARLHAVARDDPQRGGHGGEETWRRLLQDWLPPAYEVATRKYIIPEEGGDAFETDLVVFNPAYPTRLRNREEVVAGAVAATFSVKLTLDADGIKDGIARAAALRRRMKPRLGSVEQELLGMFPVGLLAHSHTWTQPRSSPEANIMNAYAKLDKEFAMHPRECIDFVCVADLNSWITLRVPWIPPERAAGVKGASIAQQRAGLCLTAFGMTDRERSPAPVAVFITHVLLRLAHSDPTLRPLVNALLLTDLGGQGAPGSPMRTWDIDRVYSGWARNELHEYAPRTGEGNLMNALL
jgi:hypothetical protein